ncbi:predicted protein [Coccidioides posadasii str. Silveira]|uniref:Predicted protein n=2 Tax=Coccidioides posadasii TaxID=199306 RepID=E9CT47_COCPS|nr:predicted protein [Coccidioides posadasii str. Silveira]KMM67342.1 hypothetical protein CPAG_03677 [Coccidioides posadasii RMSCC 3488]
MWQTKTVYGYQRPAVFAKSIRETRKGSPTDEVSIQLQSYILPWHQTPCLRRTLTGVSWTHACSAQDEGGAMLRSVSGKAAGGSASESVACGFIILCYFLTNYEAPLLPYIYRDDSKYCGLADYTRLNNESQEC